MILNQALPNPTSDIFKVKKGFVMMEHVDGLGHMATIIEDAKKWNMNSLTGVIGMSVDTTDQFIKMSGKSAAMSFDKIIVRENDAMTAALLMNSIKSEKPSVPCHFIRNSKVALHKAIEEMKDNELVIFFYDDLNVTDEILKNSNALSLRKVS